MNSGESPRIVVGVDGSEPSKAALRWAVRQAELTGGHVDAVIAWECLSYHHSWVADPDLEGLDEQAETTLSKTLAEVLGGGPDVEVHPKVLRGDPATMLLETADGADLLVVGNRGHGAFVGALLGSVSFRCVHHATCPVVVVHAGGE